MQSATPYSLLITVWPLSLSLATTCGISVDFSSSPYLDVSVQAVPLIYLCIQYMIYELLSYGLLHSDICGSLFAYNSPQLFAVNHVLLRFPMPSIRPALLLALPFVRFEFSLIHCSFFTRLIFLNRVVSLDCISSYFSYSIFKFPFSILFQEQKLTDNSLSINFHS